MVVIKKYPYDIDFSNEEIVDQVDWEVRQFLFSSDDEYIIDFQKIKYSKPNQLDQMIIIAVREAVVNYIKKVFSAPQNGGNEAQIVLHVRLFRKITALHPKLFLSIF